MADLCIDVLLKTLQNTGAVHMTLHSVPVCVHMTLQTQLAASHVNILHHIINTM